MPVKWIAIIVCLYVCVLTGNSLYAQEINPQLKGRVIGNGDKPLAAATIMLLDTSNRQVLKTIADSNGLFIFLHAADGLFILEISYAGYATYKSQPFRLAASDLGTIRLTATGALQEVTVQSKQKLIEVDGGTIVYNVSKSIHAQGSDALETLKRAPGVFVDNQDAIFLNGKRGALILLDGKQTYLSGKELADLLRSMPASAIRSIEVINTPSAKYDATGSAGIIHIKTLKSTARGLNASFNIGAAIGITPKQNMDLSFNYRKNNLNVFGSYNHFLGYSNYEYDSWRMQNNTWYDSKTDDVDKRQRMGARLGADYSIDKKNTIGVLFNSNFIIGGGRTNTTTDIGTPGQSAKDQRLYAINDYYHQQTNRYNLNMNYKYESGAGTMINFDVDYGRFEKGNGNLQSNRYSNAQDVVTSQNLYRSLNDIDIDLHAAKLDYTATIWKGTLEAGLKYSMIGTANDARFFHVLQAGDSLDRQRSNQFTFKERIGSSYINYKKNLGHFTLQAGVRMENTSNTGSLNYKKDNTDTTEKIARDYTDFFPSMSVSLKLKEWHNFSLSWSKRIERPAYQDLNPFIYLLDELSFWQGNPFLQPQYTNKVTLLYVYKSATIITASWLQTDAYSARITDTLQSSKIVMIPRNLGVQQVLSLSLTQTLAPAKWWEINFTGTVNQVKNKVAFDAYRNLALNQWSGRASVQQRFKLPYGCNGEISGYFNTRRLSGANELVRGTSQVDLGLQKTLLKGKATVRLIVTDIYKGNQFRSRQYFDGFYLSNYGYYESRQLRLNFTYKLADAGGKAPRTRNSALESEQGRIK